MKNIVHVIYPDDWTCGFAVETDTKVDPHDILEQTFAAFNHGSGSESELFLNSKKRSLSVNDVVCVNGIYYLCESFGWKEVTPQFVNELEKEVANHNYRMIHGAWFALNQVMWDRQKNNLVVA